MLAPQIIVRDTHRFGSSAALAATLAAPSQAVSEHGQATAHFLLPTVMKLPSERSPLPIAPPLTSPPWSSSWQTNALPSVDDGIQIKLLAMNELDAVIKTFIKQKDE